METVKDFFYKNKQRITEDLINALKTVIDGIKFLADLPEMDMPYMKEVGQAKLLTKMGYDVILLPRFANSFIEKEYNKALKYGSFPDGLVILVNEKNYVEFKRTNSKKITKRLNVAKDSDMTFLTITDRITLNRIEQSLRIALERGNLTEDRKVIIMSEIDGRIYKKNGLNYAESTMRAPSKEIGTNVHTRLTEGFAIPLSYLNYIKQKYLCKDESIFPYEAYKIENDKQNFLRKEVEDKNISLLLTCLRNGYGEPLVAEERKISGIGKVCKWEFSCFYENKKVLLRLLNTPNLKTDNVRLEVLTRNEEYDKKNMPSKTYKNSEEMLQSNLIDSYILNPIWFLKKCTPIIHSNSKEAIQTFLNEVKQKYDKLTKLDNSKLNNMER